MALNDANAPTSRWRSTAILVALREANIQLLILGDLQPRVERLVRQPPAPVVRMGVGAVCVGEESQAVVKERPPADVLLVVFTQALVKSSEVV